MYDSSQVGARLAGVYGLTDKVAVVTGAAQGLGREIARLFAQVGARVVVADLNGDAARGAAAEIESKGGVAAAAQVDIADDASVKNLFDFTGRTFGGIDALVNNAANRSKAELFEMTREQWDAMLNVTLRGTFLCSREAIGRMKAKGNGGSIVNISTVGSVHTTIWGVNVHYDAAKAGVDSLTRSFASEFAADGIRVNSILPGGMASEGAKQISSTYRIRGPMIGTGRIPLGRMASPLEVAQAVLFFASPASSYITGQIVAVDGGFSVS
jgi:NAD(P)-dependent dehydrogenase (short-subunit alcohol dehydrogenase family)